MDFVFMNTEELIVKTSVELNKLYIQKNRLLKQLDQASTIEKRVIQNELNIVEKRIKEINYVRAQNGIN